jgi:3-methyl-2-oxobutanoate hydroxymethyltransferase
LRQIALIDTVPPVAAAKTTADKIRGMKGSPIAALTAYDYGMARLLDEAEVPLILVGDSLGMVVLGYPDTTRVTLAEMEHHVRAVARAKPGGVIVADLPAHSYDTPDQAVGAAQRLMSAGAEAVKAEGGRTILPQIRAIVGAGIPFLGHLGMLPQHVKEEGGYHIKGKAPAEREALLEDASALDEAGVFGMVLELVQQEVAREITARVTVPTIGIGAGSGCDGQILVTTDLFGTSPDYIPRHVPMRPELGRRMVEIVREWKASIG